MADITVQASKFKFVELGRVVIFNDGPHAGRLAAIVEIIDHKRVLVEGPSSSASVPRHAAALSHLSLTAIVIPKLPRAIGAAGLRRAWEKAEVDEQWKKSTWAKKREQRQRRRALTDFERFKVMRLKKQARHEIRRTHASIRKSAK